MQVRRASSGQGVGKGEHPAKSCGDDWVIDTLLCVGDGRRNIFPFKVKHFIQDLVEPKSCREKVQDIGNADSHASDARATSALLGVDGDLGMVAFMTADNDLEC